MNDSTLPQISGFTRSLDFEEFGGVQLCAARWTDSKLHVELLLEAQVSGSQYWNIECSGVREHSLELGAVYEGVFTLQDHVLLWPHRLNTAELYFNSRPENVSGVISDLYVAHQARCTDWFPLTRFVNVLMGDLTKLLELGYGLLAKGPVSLIDTYREVLRRHKVSHSVLPCGPAKWWNGREWVEDSRVSLLLIGRSYVVASEFLERRA
jgi:hypothetical protein